VLLETISRLANQDDPYKKAAIREVREYVRKKIPSLNACRSFRAEAKRRRIMMTLNYYDLEDMGQLILKVKNRL
jgi:uncharacterized protein YdhG (YjbR/CyaY superfamily)